MTQNELWWMYFTQGTGTTIAQATVKMLFFEATVLYNTAVYSYKFGGWVVTYLDKRDPNINIEIGNVIGATVDWAVDLIEVAPTASGYIDLPVDGEGNFIFPEINLDPTFDDNEWEDCVYLGC